MQMYEPKKFTVLSNDSGSVLTLGLKDRANRTIHLHPRKGTNFIDVEEMIDEKNLRAYLYDLEKWTKAGLVSWHRKGSKPEAIMNPPNFRLPQAEGETVTAPPNKYDEEINKLIDKEKREDEKSKVSSARREVRRSPEEHPPSPIRQREAPESARLADLSKGEIDANDVPQDPPGEASIARKTTPPPPYAHTPVGELVDEAVSAGVITKAGPYFKFAKKNIARGKANTCEALEANTKLCGKVRKAMNARVEAE